MRSQFAHLRPTLRHHAIRSASVVYSRRESPHSGVLTIAPHRRRGKFDVGDTHRIGRPTHSRSRFVKTRSAALLLFIAAAAAPSLGAFVTVDLFPYVNADLHTYTDGWAYPDGGQTVDFGGVPMALSNFPLRGGIPRVPLGIIQTSNPTRDTYSIPVSIPGATRLYTLINSAFGQAGFNNGSVEVFGAGGSHAVLDLIQGFNVRDHYNGFYQNNISDPTVFSTNYDGGARLDRQVLELPAEFATDTVTELRFTGKVSNFVQGEVFLAGATFEVVPAPGAAAVATLTGALFLRRRR